MSSLLEKLLVGFSRLRVGAGAWLAGDVTLQAGTNMSIAVVGNTATFNATGGGGSALPSPFTATLVSGNLRITAPSSATPKSIDLFGQDASGGTGGGLRFAGGDGSTKGPVSFGYVSAGTYNETLSWDQTTLQLAGQFKLTNRLLSVAGGLASTPWDFKHDFSATTFATALAATLPAYRLRYIFSDKTVTALKVEYDRVTTEGMVDISLPNGSTLPAVRIGRTDAGGTRLTWSELFEFEQTTTTATLVVFGSIAIPINSVYKITVDSLSRAGSAGGTHCARRVVAQRAASGAPVFQSVSTQLSTALEQDVTDLDFAISGNNVDMACKGAASTTMTWRHRVEVFYSALCSDYHPLSRAAELRSRSTRISPLQTPRITARTSCPPGPSGRTWRAQCLRPRRGITSKSGTTQAAAGNTLSGSPARFLLAQRAAAALSPRAR